MWTEAEIVQLVEDLVHDGPFTTRNSEYQQQRKLLMQERPVIIPGIDLKVQYRDPSLEDDGHAFKNRILAAPLKLQVAALRDKPKAVEGAQRRENFHYRHYYRWRDHGVFDGPLFDMATLGIGWTHLRLNADALPIVPDFDEKSGIDAYAKDAEEGVKAFIEAGKGDLFVLEAIDPETMYWIPDRTVKIQAANVPLNPLAKLYAQKGKKVGYQDGKAMVTELAGGEAVSGTSAHWKDTATLYTVETGETCYHVLLDQPQAQNRSGKVLGAYPNVFKTPAFFATYGEKTGFSDPLRMYRSLINAKYQTAPVKNLLNTALLSAGIEAGQMRMQLKWTGDGPEPDHGAAQISIGEDGVLIPPPGYEVEGVNLQVGFDLHKAAELIEREASRYGYPKALNRPEEVSASSGYDRARQQDAVGALLDPPLQHYAAMLTEVFRAMDNGIAAMPVPVSVRNVYTKAGQKTIGETITVSPADVEESDIAVSFNSITLFSRIAMQEEALKLGEADLMHETEILADVRGIDDLQAWREQRVNDKMDRAAEERALQDANAAIDALRGQVAAEAVQEASVEPTIPTTGGQLRADRGPSMPIGVGQAMPIQPSSPEQAEMGVVV